MSSAPQVPFAPITPPCPRHLACSLHFRLLSLLLPSVSLSFANSLPFAIDLSTPTHRRPTSHARQKAFFFSLAQRRCGLPSRPKRYISYGSDILDLLLSDLYSSTPLMLHSLSFVLPWASCLHLLVLCSLVRCLPYLPLMLSFHISCVQRSLGCT